MGNAYDVAGNQLGGEVKVADLIWVETHGHSWWPAQVFQMLYFLVVRAIINQVFLLHLLNLELKYNFHLVMSLSACWFGRLLMNTMWVGTSPLKDHQGKFLFGSMEAINSKCFCPWSVVLSLFRYRLYMTFLCIFLQLVCGPSQMSFWFWNSMFWMDSRFSLELLLCIPVPFPRILILCFMPGHIDWIILLSDTWAE